MQVIRSILVFAVVLLSACTTTSAPINGVSEAPEALARSSVAWTREEEILRTEATLRAAMKSRKLYAHFSGDFSGEFPDYKELDGCDSNPCRVSFGVFGDPAFFPIPERFRNLDDPLQEYAIENDIAFVRVMPKSCLATLVPKNFITDLASVPWELRWIKPYSPSNFSVPALFHDYMYARGSGNANKSDRKKSADSRFYDLIILTGFSPEIALKAFRGVSVGGKKGFGLRKDFAFYDRPTGVAGDRVPPIHSPSLNLSGRPICDELRAFFSNI